MSQTASAAAGKVRFPISVKLILFTSLCFVIALASTIFVSSHFFIRDKQTSIKLNNHKLSEIIALKARGDFVSIVEKCRVIVSAAARTAGDEGVGDPFSGDQEILAVAVMTSDGMERFHLNNAAVKTTGVQPALFRKNPLQEAGRIKEAFQGRAIVENSSPFFRSPVLRLVLPYARGGTGYRSVLLIYLSLSRFLETVHSPGITKSFIVNDRGEILAHSNPQYVNTKANFIKLPIVKMMLESALDNGFKRYSDDKGVHHLGSFKKTGFAGTGVVSTVEEGKAFEAVNAIVRRNILISVIVLNVVIILLALLSRTITRPIARLVSATEQIKQGNFKVEVQATTRDEIGNLTESFVQMGRGLEEREKMKEAFGKFVNKTIAEKVLRGEIKLGGERKDAVIFFSDIRSFTAISEKLKPEEVVSFLNEYMTRMVQCVNDTNGVVDKFIGDAIMAVWGTPVSVGNDTENAVNAALMMRASLLEFNQGRGSAKKPLIRIGCGINSGPVLAGQIGSMDRMEYTVIGDAVNLASRIEALNKPFGTDILISEDSWNLVRDIFLVEKMQKIKVKGKEEPQQIYAVLGRKDDSGTVKSLAQLRKLLGIDSSSLKEVDPDAKEEKFTILEES